MLKLGVLGLAGSALPVLSRADQKAGSVLSRTTASPPATSTPPRLAGDSLCSATFTIRAHQLLSLVCILGGAKCPLMEAPKARQILQQLGADPSTAIRLMSNADEIPHYTELGEDCQGLDGQPGGAESQT